MKFRSILAASLLFALVSPAQEPGKPAAELEKLQFLVGTWEGKGTVVMAPGVPESPWTSKADYQWILGGHVLAATETIEFPDQEFGPLVMRSYFGWDGENQKYVTFGVANTGSIATADVHWAESGAMVSVNQGIEDGQNFVDRWVTTVKGDDMKFHGNRALGDGDFFVHVRGVGKRTSEKVSDVAVADAGAMMADAVGDHMKPFAKAAGQYTLKGSMVPMPGADPVEFGGQETYSMIFGGTLCEGRSKGDPIPEMAGLEYEAVSYFGWDAAKKCYVCITMSNMGEMVSTEGHVLDGKMVFTHTGVRAGEPVVNRGVVELDDRGAFARVYADEISGATDPARVFEGQFTKKN